MDRGFICAGCLSHRSLQVRYNPWVAAFLFFSSAASLKSYQFTLLGSRTPLTGFDSYFRAFRDENKVEPGLRHDAFLYANAEAIDSVISSPVLPSPAFVMAAEAAYDGTSPDLPPRQRGYAGSVRISIPHVYTTFFARLIPTEEDPKESPRMRHTWAEVFAKAQITHDRTYPVKSTFMGF